MRFLLVLLTILPPFAQESAIRDVVRRYVEARDARDAKAIGALFTQDADQLVSNGQWRKGHDEVVKGTMASSATETGKRSITVESVRFLGPDVAIADGRYEIAGPPETRKMWTSIICVKKPEGWRIAAIRNMLPAPAGGR